MCAAVVRGDMGVGVEVAVLGFGIGSGVRGWGLGVVEVA